MNKLVAYIVIVVTLSLTVVSSQERVTLAIPPPVATEYRLTQLTLDWADIAEGRCVVSVRLLPNAPGPDLQHHYRGTQACVMLRQLNKANLTTASLQRRVYEQLIADKVLSGAVTGSPE
jgi:hypothetical protein